MDKQRVRIVRKNDEFSAEYQVGDVFEVDSTWYGGVNVSSKTGIPLSLDKEEYEVYEEDGEEERKVDPYSYHLGAMDCFCEMVGAGVKTLAMSHPCDSRQERDSFLKDVKKLCEKYGVYFYTEDEAFLSFGGYRLLLRDGGSGGENPGYESSLRFQAGEGFFSEGCKEAL